MEAERKNSILDTRDPARTTAEDLMLIFSSSLREDFRWNTTRAWATIRKSVPMTVDVIEVAVVGMVGRIVGLDR